MKRVFNPLTRLTAWRELTTMTSNGNTNLKQRFTRRKRINWCYLDLIHSSSFIVRQSMSYVR
jgi:hypothetical protein